MLLWRNELKFLCTDQELAVLRIRLQALMRPDIHQAGSCYRIRSLYFDDLSDSALSENAAGTDARKKYRIRRYNDDTERLQLEIKSKLNAKTHKDACPIPREDCERLLAGGLPPLRAEDAPPLRAFSLLCRTALLRPKLIVEYERTAFVYPVGNVRVTFDRNICCSELAREFLAPRIGATPIQPAGLHVLEVKYDELLPDCIAQALELSTLRQSAFSKYYLGRLAVQGGISS